MAFNSTSLALGMVEAQNQGLERGEAVRIGVVASMLGTPLIAFVMARTLAQREVAEQARTAVVPGRPTGAEPPADIPPPPDPKLPDPKPATLEEVGLVAAESAFQATAAHRAAHEAEEAANEARTAAATNTAAIRDLKKTVTAGFSDLKKKLGAPSRPRRPKATQQAAAKQATA